MLEKTLESPLDCKEIQPVHSEGDQPWDFLGKNDAKAETPILWRNLKHNQWMFMKHHLYPDTGPGAGSAAAMKADRSLSYVEFIIQ